MKESKKIAILPKVLANQIAAGEVVERPASVVKELLENALDAEAEQIILEIEGGGKELIRVIDNGHGMSKEDLCLSIEPHATSKIHSAEDLDGIATLGFRGEALPSLASVSRFEVASRNRHAELASYLRIAGGEEVERGERPLPVGTRIEVRDLFWNVPARLKFMKTESTELRHISELVKAFALGHPSVHFRFHPGDGKRVLDLPPVRRLEDRVAQVLGREKGQSLYKFSSPEAKLQDGHTEIRVLGYVSPPRASKGSASSIFSFVNGRWVKDRVLQHALITAFGETLQAGRFPEAVLWLYLPPKAVDVNVHPTKAEVRFKSSGEVHRAVVRAVQSTLLRRPWLKESPLPMDRAFGGQKDAFGETRGPEDWQGGRPPLGPSLSRPRPLPLRVNEPPARSYGKAFQTHQEEGNRPQKSLKGEGSPTSSSPRPQHARQAVVSSRIESHWRKNEDPKYDALAPLPPHKDMEHEGPAFLSWLFQDEFLLAREGESLWVVSVKEALSFLAQRKLQALPLPLKPKPLLIPEKLELSREEIAWFQKHSPLLSECGIWLEPFGGQSYQLLGLPSVVSQALPGELWLALTTLSAPDHASVFKALGEALARSRRGSSALALLSDGPDDFLQQLFHVADLGQLSKKGIVLALSRTELLRRLQSQD